MEPNLELVTGSFFTGMSKAGSVLRERVSEASLKRNFSLFFFLMGLCFRKKCEFITNRKQNNAFASFALNILRQIRSP